MKKLGVAQHRFQGVLPVGQGRENSARLALAPERMRQLVAYLEEQGVPVTSYTFTLKPAPEEPVDFCSSGACSAASSVCAVTADGRVVPCSYFWGYRGDSLRDHSFAWIWENSPLLRYFRTIRLDDVHGVCRECRWLALCHGGCKAENVINGDLFTAAGSCWVAAELGGGAAAAVAMGR